MNYDKISTMDLTAPIEKLPRVGPKNPPRFRKLGIKTIRDLLWHFPARYEDYSHIISIEEISKAGQIVSIRGVVENIENSRAWKRKMAITTATISDDSGSIHVIWFNQPYIEHSLPVGSIVSLAGKVGLDKKGLYLSNPQYERIREKDETTHTGRLVPVYPETKGVTSKYLRFLIKPLISLTKSLADPLPQEMVKKYNFPNLESALRGIHFPENIGQIEAAKKRFAFEEILLFQLRVLRDRRQLQNLKAPQIKFNERLIAGFVKKLPFQLTNDQRKASYEILQDLGRPFPMNRLLNGDVGSGKTVVALIAAYQAAASGYQLVFMAPTEILARQHFQTITEILKANDNLDKGKIKVGLLIGTEAKQWPADEVTTEKVSKKIMVQKIAAGDVGILIGTHAVIQKNIKFKNLGFVIIDEQHRFGVQQRMKLIKNQALVPHLLSMTATPIPRTLALTIYGDLDVSLLKEKPSGRQIILTRVVSDDKRKAAYKFIDEQIKGGRQVFVVCPRIEVAGRELGKELSQAKLLWSEVKAVTDEYEKLSKKIFPHRRVAVIHGKMKAGEKNEIMEKFKNGQADILVSTSVIEVGVDIPNASIMMIESAERFGLAQLHQFRGRVGRSSHKSYCLLLTSSSDVPAGRRLRALEKSDNGFDLAEADLKIRGPGEFVGVNQSGVPDIAMASLADIDLIKKARLEAKLLLQKDPTLKTYPPLLVRLAEMQRLVHFE